MSAPTISNSFTTSTRPTYAYIKELKRIQRSKHIYSIDDITQMSSIGYNGTINFYHETFPRIIPLRITKGERDELPYIHKLTFMFMEIREYAKDRDFFKALPEWFAYGKESRLLRKCNREGIYADNPEHPHYKPPTPHFAFR